MKIYTIIPYTNQNNKNIKQDELSKSCCHTAKSTALIAASLLSLAAIAKSDIDYNCTYKNIVEQTSYQIADNNTAVDEKTNQKHKEPELSDEEKIHRFAIIFTLLGFLGPSVLNMFCSNNNERKITEE